MIGGVLVLLIVGFVLWLLLSAGTGFAATKLNFLEPDAPDNSDGHRQGQRSGLRVRYGVLSLRAKHILLAQKSLKIVSGFMVGLYPVDVTQVGVDEYRVHFGCGVIKFIQAWWRGEERERLAPKLIIRLVGVRIAIKGNGIDDWEKQAEAVTASIEAMNHSQANLLTTFLDKTTPNEGVPPSKLYRLVDIIINSLDMEVEGFHLSLASANHKDTRQAATQPPRQEPGGGSRRSKTGTRNRVGCEWVLGIKFDYFRLSKKANPSEETLGATPRMVELQSFALYYDIDGTPIRPSSTLATTRYIQHNSVGVPSPPSAVVRGHDGPEVHVDDGTSPSTSSVLSDTAGLRQSDDHNSFLMVESIGGTFLFPDLMCVLLGVGRQPEGNGKILSMDFDEMRGVVVELEPSQVFSLMSDALPLLAMTGPYTTWYDDVVLEWHKEAFRRQADEVPTTPQRLEKYAEALGSVPDGDLGDKKYKGDAAELQKLDKNMSLSQIMLMRMRVRKWSVTRPERLMVSANALLNSIDPFQGVLAEDLVEDLAPSVSDGGGVPSGRGDGGGGGGDADGNESDEEAPSVSSSQSEVMTPSLQTDGPQESARLESVLYYAAQQSAYASAENPVMMEVDVRMSAQNATVLVFHPPRDGKKPVVGSTSREVDLGDDGDSSVDADDDDDGNLPETNELSRQNSVGSVDLGGDEGELATEEAMRLRDSLHMPALAASVVVEDFKFGFNMLMGSVAVKATTPCAREGEEETNGGQGVTPGGDAGAATGDDEPEEGGPMQLYAFSSTIFPEAKPIRLYNPSRLGQGADLRVECFGNEEKVEDGIAGMTVSMVLGGTRVTDFGALEDGGVLPTLVGGPAAVPAAGSVGDASYAAGGTTKVNLAMYNGGRLEAGLEFQSCTVVALPGRIMGIIDVLLACLMGPPAVREAQELNAMEEEVVMEEAEEATGGVGTTEIVDARWKAMERVRSMYLFLGRLDAQFSVRVHAFSLLLPQDSRDTRTNVIMAQCSALTLGMRSGSAFEALDVNVHDFSVAPCVQRPEASDAAIVSCVRLHETGVAVALRGPLPELLRRIWGGFPLKELDLYPIPERRIVLPVNMKIKYSTKVKVTDEDTPEASTATLVADMVKHNSGTDVAATQVADREHEQIAALAGLSGEEENQVCGDGDGDGGDGDGDGGVSAVTPVAAGNSEGVKAESVAVAAPAAAEEACSGWKVAMVVQVHVSSGLRLKVTDLDIAVLQGIANSLMASLGVGQAAAAGAPPGSAPAARHSAAGKSLTFAQRRMVASLRQAFRLADANGDGTLDRAEVEALLRHNLQGQNLDPAQTEAEVLQFIALLDADGTESLDIDEFASAMMRLMSDGPDEVTLERARRQALEKAFNEADTDRSGTLDSDEIMQLLRSSDPLRTHSELVMQVSRYINTVDVNNDSQLDMDEFIELVHSMRAGNVHHGPLEPKAEEFRSWDVIRPMLEGFKTLPELLVARPANYSPPGFWELFERETYATQTESGGQMLEAVQAKMVKAFENYGFAHDAWSLLVAPAWFPGVVRVGSLTIAGGASGVKRHVVGAQQMAAPVRPGAHVYAQEVKRGGPERSSRGMPHTVGSLSGMKIHRLPDELKAPPAAPTVVDPLSSTPAAAEMYVTGIRLPLPVDAYRWSSFRTPMSPPGVKMEVDRPCTLLVCFHDENACIGTSTSGGGDGEGAAGVAHTQPSSSSPVSGSKLDLPEWVTQMGLRRTSMHIETVLPGEGDNDSVSHHVYRVFSTPIAAGTVELGSGLPGSLPYFVLLYGGNHFSRHATRNRGPSVRRPVRGVTDGDNRGRRVLRSMFRKDAKATVLGGSKGSSINTISNRSRASSAGLVVSSVQTGASGESTVMIPTPPDRHTSVASAPDSVGGSAVAVKANPSWQLTPQYSLGGATRGMMSIATKADKTAKKAASTAMKIAAISSAGTAAAISSAGIDLATKLRVRLKVTLLCEHGIFVQMDDIHRLENTPSGQAVAPTFELALRVPRLGDHRIAPKRSPPGSTLSSPSSSSSSSSSSTEALQATLDFEHVASAEILGKEDSMSMNAVFGMEGSYFNPRVQQSEHFIEPWRMRIDMRDQRGDSAPRGEMTADRHFVLNVTTGLTSLACSIMESRDFARTRYSTTSVYTELRDGTDGDDGTRLLTIENHLGVPVRVTLEDDGARGVGDKARSSPVKKAGSSPATPTAPEKPQLGSRDGSYTRIPASLYAGRFEGGGKGDEDGPPSDRISVGELSVPDAKKSLPTATVTIVALGFMPVTGVPLDLLGRGTHVFRMTRAQGSGERRSAQKWRFEGMVVKFVARPARVAAVLDLAMQLQTNVFLKNDLPRPLRVALSPESENEPNTMVPADAEVCLPFPLLHSKVLRLWKSPRTLVGGEALKQALQAEADKEARAARGSGTVGGGGGDGAAAASGRRADRFGSGGWESAASEGLGLAVDRGKEVSVEITPTTFDRNKRVVERHSQSMLVNGVSVERSDLAPTPGLVMHGAGNNDAPALWRLYVRAPYVIQNGLACDIVLWASQPVAEVVRTGDVRLSSPGSDGALPSGGGRSALKRRLTLHNFGSIPKRDVDGPRRPSSSASMSKFKFSKSWKKNSSAPYRVSVSPTGGGGGGGGGGGVGGGEKAPLVDSDSDGDDDDDTDTMVEDTDTDLDEHGEEELQEQEEELDRLSAIGAAAGGGGDRSDVTGAEGGRANDAKVMWVLKSGEEAKLEGMDMTRNLHLRVGFAPADGSSSCSDFCKWYIIEAKCHTNRTLLNKMESKEAVFSHGARGAGGARRPEFKFGVVWEHTPGNRHIHIYSKVWVVNKTGVSLAYRASIPTKDERKDKVFVRRPHNAVYRTDGDTMLFSRYMTNSTGGGGGGATGETGLKAGLPLMLTCKANTLQTMPYAMADSAVDAPLYLSETCSSKSEEPIPCLTVPVLAGSPTATATTTTTATGDGGRAGAADSWPLYCDYPMARASLPDEVASKGRQRVHLLTMHADTGSISFAPSRDCRVYVGVDKRLLAADPGPPKWLALHGFERRESLDIAVSDVKPVGLAPEGFGLYSRFCRGLSVVLLGENVNRDGHGIEEKKGGPAAMYFVVVVRVPEPEAVAEVDIGPVSLRRSVNRLFREHHRWRIRPNFKPGEPCYNDRPASEMTVAGLPEKLQGIKLLHIATSQGDKKVKANCMASFQTLQRSRVLVCFDSRAPEPPSWLASRGFTFQEDLFLPVGTGEDGYRVYAKTFLEGTEVKLGGNKASGAKRMYFVLVHTTGDQKGRTSAPPRLERPPLTPPSPANAAVVAAANLDRSVDGGGAVMAPSITVPVPKKKDAREGGVMVESNEDQVFRFWDNKSNGMLVQAPIDLDREGRGWCEPFATDAVKTAGQAKSPAGVFGVTIEALSGAFLKTRVVTVWPRFIVRNNLGRTVGVLSTLEPPPTRGKDHGQGIAKATEEENEDLKNVQRAARKTTQAVPDGASVVLYDFADPDDYDCDEEDEIRDAMAGFSVGSPSAPAAKPMRKQPSMWTVKSKKGREEKLPCVRLLSGLHKDGAARKGSRGSGSVSGGDAAQGTGGTVFDEQYVDLPTVPVLLESMGKDTYVWMQGGRYQEDVLVRVSCRMLSNGATIHVALSNETPSPPLRIENRSSTQTLCYRLGGDSEDNVRLLEPMRWNALHWVSDNKRVVEAALCTEQRGRRASEFIDSQKGKAKAAARKGREALKKISSHRASSAASSPNSGDDGGDSSNNSRSSLSAFEKQSVMYSSFQWGNMGKFGDSPRREYRTEDVGRLNDLVGRRRSIGGEVRLKVECLRPPDSVVTTVLAFSDTPDGVYAISALASKHGDEGLDAGDQEGLEGEGAAAETFARIWTGLHFEAKFAGLVLNIVDSTPSGPSELAAFTVDSFEFGKPSGTPAVTLSVWHFQLDDMRADSPHPIILAPQCTGFNSHLTKVHNDGLRGAPAFRVEIERNVEVSLTHHMWVVRSIKWSLGKVRCSVHVDFWIDVQDVLFASLNWTSSSPSEARARAIADTQGVVGKLLQAPASDATVDRIYIGEYHQAEIEVAVDFHLGTKVAALLSSKPAPDGDEEKDEGGFGASLAMMPLGAVGGVAWGLLSSFGAGIANASPTFNFDAYEMEHYYGSKSQAVRLVVMSFVKQGVVQAYKVLGHIDILGDPLSLGKSISSGVIGFVTKTGGGHIGEGSKDLVKGVVGGAASSASKVTESLDSMVRQAGGIGAEAPSGMESAKAPEHLGQGITQGAMYFGHTLKDGLTGVVMKPVKGAQKDGAAGFLLGVGQGVIGLVAAPVSAALGATSKITASIDATTRLLDDDSMDRRREPRHPLGRGERDDRDRLKQETKPKRDHKKPRDSFKSSKIEEELEEIVSDDDIGGDAAPVDARAEAGGMGLLLVPLTPADLRTNYPKDYIERCQADMADRAGAVAIAKAVEEKLKKEEKNQMEVTAVDAVTGRGGGSGVAEESKGEGGGDGASEYASPLDESG